MKFWKRKLLAVWHNASLLTNIYIYIYIYIYIKRLSEMSHGSPSMQTHAGENNFHKVGSVLKTSEFF